MSRADEIEQPGSSLRCLYGTIVCALLGLVKGDKIGTSKIMLAEECEASLSAGRGLDDDVIQHTASRRNGNIIFLTDGGKVTETSKNTNLGQLATLLGCFQNPGNSL